MSFDYHYVLPPTGAADNQTVREMFDDIKLYVNSVVPSGGAAPFDAQYVTLATNTTLTVERVLTGTSNQVIITDNGAGSTVVLSLPQSIANTSSPSFAGILYRNSSGNTVTINPPSSFSNYILTLPTDDGSANQFLQTDGSGGLTWADVTTSIAANRALSNLSSVSINASLVPGSSLDLGTSGAPWHDIFINRDIVLFEEGTSNSILIKSPTSLASYTLKLPTTAGSTNYVLKTDGTGVTDWVAQTSIAGLANYDLSNLNVPAVNVSIKPGTTGSIDLGSNSKAWREIYLTDGAAFLDSFGNQIVVRSPSSNVGYFFTLPQADGVTDDLLTNTDGAGTTSWVARSALGLATTALSNLSAVAINASLLPASSNAIDVGSSSFQFRDAYLANTLVISKAGGASVTISASTSGSFVTPYTLTLPIDDGTNGQVLTTDGSGVLSWGSGTAAGAANTALSNLASVAINTALLPGTDNSIALGSASKQWTSVFLSTSEINTATSNQFVLGTTRTVTITAPTPASSSRTVTIPDLSASYSIVGTEGTQTVNGNKTLSGTINLSGLTASLPLQLDASKNIVSTAIDLSTSQVTGNLGVTHLNSGTAAGSTTFWRGDGTWATPSGSGTVNSGTSGQIAYYASSTTAVSGNTELTYASHVLTFAASASATSEKILIQNTNTTASSDAKLVLDVPDTNNGSVDPRVDFSIGGTTIFALGIRNDNGNSFSLSRNAGTLGTNEAIAVSGSSGAVSIRGTNTNDSATAGFVGEVVESTISSATSLSSSGSRADLTSIALTAGHWIIMGNVLFNLNTGTGMTAVEAGISDTSGNNTTNTTFGFSRKDGAAPTGNNNTDITVGPISAQLSGSATYYLKYQGSYSGGTPQARGHILAVRIR